MTTSLFAASSAFLGSRVQRRDLFPGSPFPYSPVLLCQLGMSFAWALPSRLSTSLHLSDFNHVPFGTILGGSILAFWELHVCSALMALLSIVRH